MVPTWLALELNPGKDRALKSSLSHELRRHSYERWMTRMATVLAVGTQTTPFKRFTK